MKVYIITNYITCLDGGNPPMEDNVVVGCYFNYADAKEKFDEIVKEYGAYCDESNGVHEVFDYYAGFNCASFEINVYTVQ